MKRIFTLFTLLFIVLSGSTQQRTSWNELREQTTNFYQIKAAFQEDYRNVDMTSIRGWKQFKRWEYFYERRVFPHGDLEQYRHAVLAYQQEFAAARNVQSRIAVSNWTFIGPNTVPSGGGGAGRLNKVHVVPGTTNQYVVTSPGGGVWTYNGTTWSTSTDFLSQIGFGDVAINPTNTNIMYATSGDNDNSDAPCIGVYKSTNGGVTWQVSGLTTVNRMYRIIVHPTSPNIVLVATNSGVYRSTDSGANWTLVLFETNIRDMEFKPGDPNVIYAAKMSATTVLYRSVDAGASFSSTGIGSGLPTTSNGRAAIAVTDADPNYVYILIGATNNGYKGVYRSVDSGLTFTTQSTSPNLLGWSNTGGDTGGQQWYDLALAASPSDKDLIVVGGVNIWRSSNGGVNWSIVGHWTGSGAPYVHADIHDLSFGSNGTTVYAGTDGGIFIKGDINTPDAWTDLSNGLAIAQMYAMGQSTQSQNKVLSGWQDNGTNLWNGTASWSRPIGGDGFESIIDYSDDTYQYGELYYGNIRRSTNSGTSFSTIVNSGGSAGTVSEDGEWNTPYVINPRNPLSLYVGKSRVYKSVNRGTNWTALATFGSASSLIDAMAIAPSDTNYIYASKSGQLWKSVNNGVSFSEITAGLPGSFISYIAVDESSPDIVYVTLSNTVANSKVFVSTNGGGSWTNISNGLPNLPANTIALDTTSSTNAMYVGMDAGVYYRDDNNTTWAAFSSNLPNVEITELEIQYGAQKIRAATYGRGLWESPLESGVVTSLTASFTSSIASICRGNTVQFTNTSTGSPAPTTWSWTFEGGTPATSNSPNPVVTYNTNGVYDVTLTVGNGVTTHTIVMDNYVTVTSVTPSISITGDAEVCQGKPASFVASGSNLGAPTYNWTVNGVAQTTTGPAFTSTTLATGDVVKVNVTSTALCAQPATTESNTITVTIKPVPPKPVITGQYGLLTSSNPTGNQWMLFGVDIPGATGQTYLATKDGAYTVKTTINGCTSVSSDVFNVKIEGLFKVFPIPNPGDLNVLFYVPQNASRYALRIVNSKGQVVFREEGTTSAGVYSKVYPIHRLAAGTYQIRIVTGDRKYNKTFIKSTN